MNAIKVMLCCLIREFERATIMVFKQLLLSCSSVKKFSESNYLKLQMFY